jgi:hypothetical protein
MNEHRSVPFLPISAYLESPPEHEPPLAGDDRADVAVVGGGLTGLSTALALQLGRRRRGARARVLRLRRERPQRGASDADDRQGPADAPHALRPGANGGHRALREIQPIHTLSNERTNATYYSDVRISDRYRIGPVDGGWAVLGHALHLEHGASGATGSTGELRDMISAAVAWARGRRRRGGPALEDEHVREVLGRAAAAAEVIAALARRQLWSVVNRRPERGEGAMVSAFKKDAMIAVASQLMDLTAPESVLQRGAAGALDDGALEFGYRLAAANAIYGGTAEILKSIVAEAALGMPRSRS